MIEPEICHHFLKLTLAVNCTKDLGLLQFLNKLLLRTQPQLAKYLLCFLPAHLQLLHFLLSRSSLASLVLTFGKLYPSSFECLTYDLLLRILPGNLLVSQRDALKSLKLCLRHRIRDTFRPELLLEELLPTQRFHPLDISGPRSEGGPIQQMSNLLLARQLFNSGLLLGQT